MRPPSPTELLTFDRPRERFRPVIVDPNGGEIPLKWQQELPDITPESLRWSPSGRHVLFLEVLPASGARRLFTASGHDGLVVEVKTIPGTVAAAEWTSNGDGTGEGSRAARRTRPARLVDRAGALVWCGSACQESDREAARSSGGADSDHGR